MKGKTNNATGTSTVNAVLDFADASHRFRFARESIVADPTDCGLGAKVFGRWIPIPGFSDSATSIAPDYF